MAASGMRVRDARKLLGMGRRSSPLTTKKPKTTVKEMKPEDEEGDSSEAPDEEGSDGDEGSEEDEGGSDDGSEVDEEGSEEGSEEDDEEEEEESEEAKPRKKKRN